MDFAGLVDARFPPWELCREDALAAGVRYVNGVASGVNLTYVPATVGVAVGIRWVGPKVQLVAVGKRVEVRVGVQRIGAENFGLGEVVDAVAVAIGDRRIGAEARLGRIGEAVAICVGSVLALLGAQRCGRFEVVAARIDLAVEAEETEHRIEWNVGVDDHGVRVGNLAKADGVRAGRLVKVDGVRAGRLARVDGVRVDSRAKAAGLASARRHQSVERFVPGDFGRHEDRRSDDALGLHLLQTSDRNLGGALSRPRSRVEGDPHR